MIQTTASTPWQLWNPRSDVISLIVDVGGECIDEYLQPMTLTAPKTAVKAARRENCIVFVCRNRVGECAVRMNAKA